MKVEICHVGGDFLEKILCIQSRRCYTNLEKEREMAALKRRNYM